MNPADGRTLWSFPRKGFGGIGPGTPLYLDPQLYSNHLYFVSGYGGCTVRIADGTGTAAARPEAGYGYTFANLTLWNGCIYGGESGPGDGNITGALNCVDVLTGKILWRHEGYGANTLAVDGRLIIQTTAGDLIIAEASSKEYKPLHKVRIRAKPDYDYSKGDRPMVTAPAFSKGRLYCRDGGAVICFDLLDAADPGGGTGKGNP